jgi:hypothetical protein
MIPADMSLDPFGKAGRADTMERASVCDPVLSRAISMLDTIGSPEHFPSFLGMDIPPLTSTQLSMLYSYGFDNGRIWAARYGVINAIIRESWERGDGPVVLDCGDREISVRDLCGEPDDPIRLACHGGIGEYFGDGCVNVMFEVEEAVSKYFGYNAYHCVFDIDRDAHLHFDYFTGNNICNIYRIGGDMRQVLHSRDRYPATTLGHCVFNVKGSVKDINAGTFSDCTFRVQDIGGYRSLVHSFREHMEGYNGELGREAVHEYHDEPSGDVLSGSSFAGVRRKKRHDRLSVNRVLLVDDISRYFKGGDRYGQ